MNPPPRDAPKIRIRGEGIAAYCCASLLARAGCRVTLERTDRPRVPAIMLNDPALALIRDVFELPALFADLPRVARRVVSWGVNVKPAVLPHSAVVVSEDQLLVRLRAGMDLGDPDPAGDFDFTVLASRPVPDVEEHRFGSRVAATLRVRLRNPEDASACCIESFPEGWLFLVPQFEGAAWLIAVGGDPDGLRKSSKVIGPRVEVVERPADAFPTAPRIVSPLAGPGWLACGTAAMGFDPICGDGTAHAVREAILAAAVIRAATLAEDAGAIFEHYDARLNAGFHRHLQLCREFYRTGGEGAWWHAELAALEAGIVWCENRARAHGPFRFRLDGFDLIAL